MKSFISFFVLSIILFSCTENEKTVFLKLGDADGLKTNDAITLKGYKVSEISDIKIVNGNQILTKISFDNKISLPIDSKFKIETGLLGEKRISIELGKDTGQIMSNDTIEVIDVQSEFSADSTFIDIGKFFKKITGQNQNDSILIELRRLNENIEALIELENFKD